MIFFFILTCSNIFASNSKLKEKKILICGVCRDVEAACENTINSIETLGSGFKEYAVIIYENNSSDGTAKKFSDWAEKNRRVTFISEHLTNEQLSADALSFDWMGNPMREERIARARNIVLSHARNVKYNDFDYLIMADLDFTRPWPVEEILKTVQINSKWDCISANGCTENGDYYDRYALRCRQFPFGPEVLGNEWWPDLTQTPFNLVNKKTLKRVFSAFGGLAIYKRTSIINFSYYGHVTEDLKRDCKNIMLSLSISASSLQKYFKLNGLGSEPNLSDVPVVFFMSSGSYKHPSCCEHVTLHASMRLHGFDKMFINPKMIMRY
jgi:hypothetical protein